MSWKRLAVLVAAALCTTCSSVTVQGDDTAAGAVAEHPALKPGGGITAAIEVLGVCGQVHQAVLRLAPRKPDGLFDTESMAYEPGGADSSTLLMPAPEGLGLAAGGGSPRAMKLYEHLGKVQAARLYWKTEGDKAAALLDEMTARISLTMGQPHRDEDGEREWFDESLRVVIRQEEDGAIASLIVACASTEDAYFAALDAARETLSEEGAAAESDTDDGGLPPNPWLDRRILDVLASWGDPHDEPTVVGTNIVGLHYRDFMDGYEVPVEGWWWFVDGRAVYVCSEFLPGSGSNRAMASYQTYRKTLVDHFGEPTEVSSPAAGDRNRVLYRVGPQRLVMELFDPDGDPWFRIEIFDSIWIDVLPAELHPKRSLPARYTPPPADSGLTRDHFSGEVGAG